jgi:hypothetical protein
MTAARFLVIALVLAAVPPLHAQEDATAIAGLVGSARAALDNLDYSRADSIARTLLDLGRRASDADRVTALQILAAALYPEERAAQHRDSAYHYLELLVRATPAPEIPREISWTGLDSLVLEARRRTFAAWPDTQKTHVVANGNGAVRVAVTANRPARFELATRPLDGGDWIVLDSVGPAPSARLTVFDVHDGRAMLPSGGYELRLAVTDPASGERLTLATHAHVETPPLERVPVPALDSARLLPERTPRRPARIALFGFGLGGMTALATHVFPGTDVGGVTPDGRAYAVGGALAVGALLGALLDRGKALDENVEGNLELRADHERLVRAAESENARRHEAHRARFTVEGGWR